MKYIICYLKQQIYANICLSNDENILNNGIWELIEYNKISFYDLTKENM